MVVMRDKKNIRNQNQLKSEIKINVKIYLEIQNQNKKEVLKNKHIHQTLLIEKNNLHHKILEIKKLVPLKKDKLSSLIGMDIILMGYRLIKMVDIMYQITSKYFNKF